MRLSRKSLLVLIFLGVALLNVRYGRVIMGFDNSSPFFSSTATLHRIFSTDNFFHYGGMLFSPAFLLSFLGIPAWLNSYLTYFGAMVIGLYFSSLIVLRTLPEEKKSSNSLRIGLLTLLLLGNLIPHWAFSVPILIFAPSFAGIPVLLYLLTQPEADGKKEHLGTKVLLVIGLLFFYSTSINVAAFTLYFLESIVLALIFKEKTLTLQSMVKRAGIIAAIWLFIVQGILLFKEKPTFIVSESVAYGQALAQDNKSNEVTSSLFLMEEQRNSFVNVARFATGWITLTDGNQKFLSSYKQVIDSIFGIVVTLVPVVYTIYYLIKRKATLTKKERLLALLWLSAIFLSSSYSLIFTKMVPYLGVVLRWISSKLWALLFFPFIYLLSQALQTKEMPNFGKVVTYVALGIISLPWLFGIVNRHQQISVPPYYLDTFSKFSENDTVLYLPDPQRLYMREYSWGYYGSGFLTYLTSAKILDNGSFHPEQNTYLPLVQSFISCDTTALKKEHITQVVVDFSTITGKIPIPSCYNTYSRDLNGELIIIHLQ